MGKLQVSKYDVCAFFFMELGTGYHAVTLEK